MGQVQRLHLINLEAEYGYPDRLTDRGLKEMNKYVEHELVRMAADTQYGRGQALSLTKTQRALQDAKKRD